MRVCGGGGGALPVPAQVRGVGGGACQRKTEKETALVRQAGQLSMSERLQQNRAQILQPGGDVSAQFHPTTQPDPKTRRGLYVTSNAPTDSPATVAAHPPHADVYDWLAVQGCVV